MSFIQNLTNSITKAYHLSKVQVIKHGPTALIITGTLGLAYAGYEAYKAKDKVNETLDKYEVMEINEQPFTRTQVALDITKDISKPLLIGATSVALIATGTTIQNKRLRMVTAALAAVTEEHYRYRSHAREVLDAEQYKMLETREVDHVNTETGEVTKEAVAVNNSDLFARWFQYSEHHVKDDQMYNEMFIKDVSDWASTQLKRKGVLTYVELMEKFGFNDYNSYHLQFGWYESTGLFIEYIENEIFDEKDLCRRNEYLVRWTKPVPLYS